jgi:hypothetical protein
MTFDLITLRVSDEEHKLCRSSLCNFLQYPFIFSLLGPNILISTLFSNTLNLCSSLRVKDPYKTTDRINFHHHHHHHHLHGLGFLKACSGFKISYKNCLKLNPMNILKLFSPSSTWTSLVSSASGFVVK